MVYKWCMNIPIVKKPWFGPKLIGWGWGIRSGEGALVSLVYVATAFSLAKFVRSQTERELEILALTAVFIAVAYLTGARHE